MPATTEVGWAKPFGTVRLKVVTLLRVERAS
jgi:hypothetical protein